MELFTSPGEVVGAVFVDAISGYSDFPIKLVEMDFLGALDYERITGLGQSWKLLTEEEWQEVRRDGMEREGESVDADGSAVTLHGFGQYKRKVLGRARVSVVMGNFTEDQRRLVDEAERVGLGSPEQRALVKSALPMFDEAMEKMQREQLGLSTEGRMVFARESGHWPHVGQSEIVIEEIKWVLAGWVESMA